MALKNHVRIHFNSPKFSAIYEPSRHLFKET